MLPSNRMRKARRAQGLPINVIIILLLGLLVLAIVFVFFQGKITKSGKELKTITESKCETPNTVKPIGECDDIVYGSFTNVKIGQQVCCKPPK